MYVRVPCYRITRFGEEYSEVRKDNFPKQQENAQQVASESNSNAETADSDSRDQPVEVSSHSVHIDRNNTQIPNKDNLDLEGVDS